MPAPEGMLPSGQKTPLMKRAAHGPPYLRSFSVRDPDAALGFVLALGFCYAFTPGPGRVPALFQVLATDSEKTRWSWVWKWKEELPQSGRAYYGRVLHGRPSFISLEFLPAFYATTGNLGEPDDPERAYEEGRLSRLAYQVAERLVQEGPATTRLLKRLFPGSDTAIDRALAELQRQFLVVKVDEVEVGGYSYRWDTFDRHWPDAVGQARALSAREAARRLALRYLQLVGGADEREVQSVFGWPELLVAAALAGLRDAGEAEQVKAPGGRKTLWTPTREWLPDVTGTATPGTSQP